MTRRYLLLAAVVVLVAVAGCTGAITGDESGTGLEPIEQAPQSSELVMHMDMAVMDDEETERLIDALPEEEFDDELDDELDEEQNADDVWAEFESETGLDPEAVNELLVFSQNLEQADVSQAGSEAGVIVHSEWEEDELIDAFESTEGVELTATEHAGEEVLYEPTGDMPEGEEFYVGWFGGGEFVVGDEGAVRDALDIVYADGDAVDGELRETYDGTRDGYMTMAVDLRSQDLGQEADMGQEIPSTQFMSMVYYTDSGSVGIESRLTYTNEEDAGNMADTIEGLIGLFQMQMGSEEPELSEQLDNIEIEQDGTAVGITYEGNVDDLEELLAEA